MTKKALVSTKALLARINRKYRRAGTNIVVRTSRGHRIYDLGPWYAYDFGRDLVVEIDVEIESYGRELGVLCMHEVWDLSASIDPGFSMRSTG